MKTVKFFISISVWTALCFNEFQSELSLARGTFILYSYKYVHDDGRVSYPLCFIFSSPAGNKALFKRMQHFVFCHFLSSGTCLFMFVYLCWTGCKPEQQMMYAGSLNKLVQTVELTKVSELPPTVVLNHKYLLYLGL